MCESLTDAGSHVSSTFSTDSSTPLMGLGVWTSERALMTRFLDSHVLASPSGILS